MLHFDLCDVERVVKHLIRDNKEDFHKVVTNLGYRLDSVESNLCVNN